MSTSGRGGGKLLLSEAVEHCLGRALELANDRRHEYATLDHIMLALTEDEAAVATLGACRIDVARLRRDLTAHLDSIEALEGDQSTAAKPDAEFQQAIQSAATRLFLSGGKEVTTTDLVVAIILAHARKVSPSSDPETAPDPDRVHPAGSRRARTGRGSGSKGKRRTIVYKPVDLVMSAELEEALDKAKATAVDRSHAYLTLEHLLFALTDEPKGAELLNAAAVDIDRLRSDLLAYFDGQLGDLAGTGTAPEPTKGLCRVLEKAAKYVQAVGRPQMTGADVIVELFGEQDSHAVYCLNEQDMTRYDAVSFMAHGRTKSGNKDDA